MGDDLTPYLKGRDATLATSLVIYQPLAEESLIYNSIFSAYILRVTDFSASVTNLIKY